MVILVGAQCRAQKSFFKALGDVGLDLTPKCQEQVKELVANFGIDESSWALQSKYDFMEFSSLLFG